MSKFVEIRSYRLKPGSGREYHRLMAEAALPLLLSHRVDVVAYGPSRHDPDAYYLIRAFDSLEHRDHSEEAFYGSAEWRQGPRDAVQQPQTPRIGWHEQAAGRSGARDPERRAAGLSRPCQLARRRRAAA